MFNNKSQDLSETAFETDKISIISKTLTYGTVPQIAHSNTASLSDRNPSSKDISTNALQVPVAPAATAHCQNQILTSTQVTQNNIQVLLSI